MKSALQYPSMINLITFLASRRRGLRCCPGMDRRRVFAHETAFPRRHPPPWPEAPRSRNPRARGLSRSMPAAAPPFESLGGRPPGLGRARGGCAGRRIALEILRRAVPRMSHELRPSAFSPEGQSAKSDTLTCRCRLQRTRAAAVFRRRAHAAGSRRAPARLACVQSSEALGWVQPLPPERAALLQRVMSTPVRSLEPRRRVQRSSILPLGRGESALPSLARGGAPMANLSAAVLTRWGR
jgi:hypothetical protein